MNAYINQEMALLLMRAILPLMTVVYILLYMYKSKTVDLKLLLTIAISYQIVISVTFYVGYGLMDKLVFFIIYPLLFLIVLLIYIFRHNLFPRYLGAGYL